MALPRNGDPEDAAHSLDRAARLAAQGAPEEAARCLEAIPDAELLQLDFQPTLQSFSKAGFARGEARLAPLVRQRYPGKLLFRLHNVRALIRIGAVDDAFQELKFLSAQPKIATDFAEMLELFEAIDRVDLATGLFRRLCRENRLSPALMRANSLRLIETYKARGMRDALSEELIHLAALSGEEEDQLIEAVRVAMDAQKLDLLPAMLQHAPHLLQLYPILQIYDAERIALTDRAEGCRRLLAFLELDAGQCDFWIQLAHSIEKFLGPAMAMPAAEKALRHAGPAKLSTCQALIVELLASSEGPERGLKQIRAFLEAGGLSGASAGKLAYLATRLHGRTLAIELVGLWLKESPNDINANFAAARAYINIKSLQEARRYFLAIIRIIEAGHAMSEERFGELIDVGGRIGYDLERRAIALALEKYPGSRAFAAFASQDRDSFAAKFSGGKPGASGANAQHARLKKPLATLLHALAGRGLLKPR